MKSFSPQKSKIPEIVWKESILKLEIVPKVLGSYLFKYICPPWVSWPKVLCKPHYCNSHLESEVSKLGQPHQGVVQDSFEISFFKFLFSHKYSKWGRKCILMSCASLNRSPQQIPLLQLPFANEAKSHYRCREFWADSSPTNFIH